MSFAENYFFRHTFLLPQITEPLSGLLRYIVVIPSYMEEDLISTLISLGQADRPDGHVEVLIIVNFSETDTSDNKNWSIKHHAHLVEWCKLNSQSNFQFVPVLLSDLPKKHAGTGLARKTGMDIALHRFVRINSPEGLILSLDADTQVAKNYFTAIGGAMDTGKAGGCIIKFEHSIAGKKYSEKVYKAIVSYELHLRYYRNILSFIGFPFAQYTIGSCFGVTAAVYARHGGMNRRKAGEDFYFLNKLFPHEYFIRINTTCVYPSPRPSLRVPFGTGPVIHELVNSDKMELMTYHPQAFFDLKDLFSVVEKLFIADEGETRRIFSGLSYPLQEFLTVNSYSGKLEEIRKNTAGLKAFTKRFFLWFDGFLVVRYLNFVHRIHFSKIPVQQAARIFLLTSGKLQSDGDESYLLEYFRELDSK